MQDKQDMEKKQEDAFPLEGGSKSEDRTLELEAEVASLKDRLLRTMADLENLRKRALREQEDISKYAVTGFARDMLAVLDNLKRATDSVTPAALEGHPLFQSVVEGVIMTEKQLESIFTRHGIQEVPGAGAPFDHDIHQAMMEVETDGTPGSVAEVMQAGYKIHDRLLRPAMVSVAKKKEKTMEKEMNHE